METSGKGRVARYTSLLPPSSATGRHSRTYSRRLLLYSTATRYFGPRAGLLKSAGGSNLCLVCCSHTVTLGWRKRRSGCSCSHRQEHSCTQRNSHGYSLGLACFVASAYAFRPWNGSSNEECREFRWENAAGSSAHYAFVLCMAALSSDCLDLIFSRGDGFDHHLLY